MSTEMSKKTFHVPVEVGIRHRPDGTKTETQTPKSPAWVTALSNICLWLMFVGAVNWLSVVPIFSSALEAMEGMMEGVEEGEGDASGSAGGSRRFLDAHESGSAESGSADSGSGSGDAWEMCFEPAQDLFHLLGLHQNPLVGMAVYALVGFGGLAFLLLTCLRVSGGGLGRLLNISIFLMWVGSINWLVVFIAHDDGKVCPPAHDLLMALDLPEILRVAVYGIVGLSGILYVILGICPGRSLCPVDVEIETV